MDVIDQDRFMCTACELSFNVERVLRNHIFDVHVSRFKREIFQGQMVKLIDDGHDYKVVEQYPNECKKYKLVRYVDGQPMIAYANSEKLDLVLAKKTLENQMIYYENGVRPFEHKYIDSLILARILEIVYDTDLHNEMFVMEKLTTGDLDYVRPEAVIIPNQKETDEYVRILSTAEIIVKSIANALATYECV